MVFLFTVFPMKKIGETPGFRILIGGDDTVRASMLSEMIQDHLYKTNHKRTNIQCSLLAFSNPLFNRYQHGTLYQELYLYFRIGFGGHIGILDWGL